MPLAGDDDKRLGSIFGNTGLDEPAAHNGASTADSTSAVYRGLASSTLIVCQNGHDASNEARVGGYGPVWDREVMVLHFARIDAKSGDALIELRRVGRKFAILGQVDEGADAGLENKIELLKRRAAQ